jgi:hypothetical protein
MSTVRIVWRVNRIIKHKDSKNAEHPSPKKETSQIRPWHFELSRLDPNSFTNFDSATRPRCAEHYRDIRKLLDSIRLHSDRIS